MSDLPLWLDETWSAMIATQTGWVAFWREAWLDCNPPVYYLLLKLWVIFAGDSNFVLRLPSLIFTTTAAFVALKWAPKELGGTGAWTWAALLLFWMHSLTMSVDARGYGLMLLGSTACCIVFAKLYNRLSFRDAALWVALCDLLFLTHYFAATLIAVQGVILICRHRLDLVRVWPAGLIGIPALAWFAYQMPRLQDYARPDVAWYDPLNSASTLHYTQYVFGHPAATFLPLVLLTAFAGLAFNFRKGRPDVSDSSRHFTNDAALWATACSGLLGLLFAFALGAMQASLTGRYLVPLVPPIMLGIVLIALQSQKRELICTLLVGIYLVTSLNVVQLRQFAQNRNDYGYEKGSDFIAQYRPTHLVFAWDHPASKILDKNSLEKIGGFFLHRSGLDFKTTALVLGEYDNPNTEIAKAANGERPAIIWLYNTRRKSAARHFPPTFENNPEWICRHHTQPDANGELGAIACVKKGRADA